MKKILFMLTVLICAGNVYATTYYAAPTGQGGCSTNTASPQGGINNALACLAAGDTLVLKPGIYREVIPSGNIVSGVNSSQKTTVRGESNRTAILQPNFGTARLLSIGENNTQHDIIIDGLVFDGSDTGSSIAVVALDAGYGGSNYIFQNNEIRNVKGNGTASSGFAMVCCGGSGVEVRNNWIHDVGLGEGVGGTHHSYGIYLGNGNALIEGNTIQNTTGYAIHGYNGGNPGAVSNVIFRNNYIVDTGAPVFFCGDNNLIYNNVLLRAGTGYGCQTFPNEECGGIRLGGACGGYNNTGNKIYNNTIVNSNVGVGACIALATSVGGTQAINPIIRDNICSGNAVNGVGEYNATGVQKSNNLCNTSGNGCDIVASPGFLGSGGGALDYRLGAGSAAIDAGANTGIGVDYAGVNRPQGSAYDVGAFEFITSTVPATYYVAKAGSGGSDSNTCQQAQSISTPKLTIGAALTCAQSGGGDVIYVRSGTYTERIDSTVQSITGGSSWGSALLVAAYQSEVVTLAPILNSSQHGINIASGGYIIFDKLRIDGSGTGSNGVRVSNPGNHIRFSNGDIGAFINALVEFSACTGCEVKGSSIHNNQVNWGAVLVRDAGVDNIVEGNTIFNFKEAGIADISYIGSRNVGTIIKGNIVRSAVLSGGYEGGIESRGSNSQVVNNLVYSNQPTLIRITDASGVKVYNNTAYMGSATLVSIGGGTTSSVEVKNNIFYSNVDVVDTGTSTSFANNLCGVADTGCTIVGDPLFVDSVNGNFHLQPCSPALNVGGVLGTVTTDIIGVNRPQGAGYDIGAYEEIPAQCNPVEPPVVVQPKSFTLRISR